MNLRELYEIRLGKYQDMYMVTQVEFVPNGKHNATLRRVYLPKTKIDGVRLPDTVFIRYFASPTPNTINPTKRKKTKK